MGYSKIIENIFVKDINNFNYIPSLEYIKKRKWYFRMYIEYYDLIEASFIFQAIKNIDNKCILFYINEDGAKISQIKENIKIDDVAYFHSNINLPNMNIYDSGLTNPNFDYLFISDAENKFFMLFGKKSFIKEAIPVDYETYKLYYKSFYGNWGSPTIDDFIIRLWNLYPIP